MFKVNNKDTRNRRSSFSILNFEHVNADWVTDFVVGSFPIIEKSRYIFTKVNTCEIWTITLGSFCLSFQIIS